MSFAGRSFPSEYRWTIPIQGGLLIGCHAVSVWTAKLSPVGGDFSQAWLILNRLAFLGQLILLDLKMRDHASSPLHVDATRQDQKARQEEGWLHKERGEEKSDLYRADSMALINFLEEGEVMLPYLSIGLPSLPIRILPKFHLTLPLRGPLSPIILS